jgi:hypothetical protein
MQPPTSNHGQRWCSQAYWEFIISWMWSSDHRFNHLTDSSSDWLMLRSSWRALKEQTLLKRSHWKTLWRAAIQRFSFSSRLCSSHAYCQYPTDRVPPRTSFTLGQGAERVLTSCHAFRGSGSRLPTREGSSVAKRPVALDPVSLPGRASVLPRVLWLWIPPPC